MLNFVYLSLKFEKKNLISGRFIVLPVLPVVISLYDVISFGTEAMSGYLYINWRVYVCLFVASFETFGSGSFGGPLGVRWVLVVKSQNGKISKW